jgi:hypothetical protein
VPFALFYELQVYSYNDFWIFDPKCGAMMYATFRHNFARASTLPQLRFDLFITAVISSLAPIGLIALTHRPWRIQFVESLAIGLSSWFFIELSRLATSREPDALIPPGLKGLALVLPGSAVGFICGRAISNAWRDLPLLRYEAFTPEWTGCLILTMVLSVNICNYCGSRWRSRYLEGVIAIAQRNATEARLKLLATQLEPHMLFNTLANLRALIPAGPQRAVTMLDRLNSFLRVTLDGSRTLAYPLSAEFDRLGDYLELMSVRMGARLRYTLDLPEELRAVPVPSLLLQPLVENAIKHGLEPHVEGGRIDVSARREDGMLVLTVRDSGAGFDTGLPRQSKGSFGLTQVFERVASAYDGQGRVEVQSQPGAGTAVHIRLPQGAHLVCNEAALQEAL